MSLGRVDEPSGELSLPLLSDTRGAVVLGLNLELASLATEESWLMLAQQIPYLSQSWIYPAPTDLNLHTHIVIVNIPRRLHTAWIVTPFITSAN